MEEMFQKIYQKHALLLKNLEKKNKKIFILLSSVPGAGKTTISRAIEERYGGVRVNNDDVRDIIDELGLAKTGEEKQKLLMDYMDFLRDELKDKNILLISDSSIDRRPDPVYQWSEKNGFEPILIRIVVPEEILVKRLKERKNAQMYIGGLPKWFTDHEEFNKNRKPDYILDNSGNLDLEDLFRFLDSKIL